MKSSQSPSRYALGGLAVTIALWLGLTAPSVSPVTPAAPATAAQSITAPTVPVPAGR